MMERKVCCRCKLDKILDEFGSDSSKKDGKNIQCKPCGAISTAAWRAANLDKDKERKRKYYATHPAITLRRKYNMSVDTFYSTLVSQDYKCGICRIPFADSAPYVDHDHSCCPDINSCGKCVRGLLCKNCNTGLGFFKDDPFVLSMASLYVRPKNIT